MEPENAVSAKIVPKDAIMQRLGQKDLDGGLASPDPTNGCLVTNSLIFIFYHLRGNVTMNYYDLGDRPDQQDCEALGVESSQKVMATLSRSACIAMGLDGSKRAKIQAVFKGEQRLPLKGEWYLLGPKITAYKAPNDLSTEHHMARLVITQERTIIEEVTLDHSRPVGSQKTNRKGGEQERGWW